MSAQRAMIAAAFGSVVLLAGAYLFQSLGYAPCKMCLWQRWPHMVAIALGAVAMLRPTWLVAIGGCLAAFTTSATGTYHAGVEQGWWPGPSSCSGGTSLGGISGGDLLSTDVVDRVIMCDEVSWAFLGLSMAAWNAVLSFALALLWVYAARRALAAPVGTARDR